MFICKGTEVLYLPGPPKSTAAAAAPVEEDTAAAASTPPTRDVAADGPPPFSAPADTAPAPPTAPAESTPLSFGTEVTEALVVLLEAPVTPDEAVTPAIDWRAPTRAPPPPLGPPPLAPPPAPPDLVFPTMSLVELRSLFVDKFDGGKRRRQIVRRGKKRGKEKWEKEALVFSGDREATTEEDRLAA